MKGKNRCVICEKGRVVEGTTNFEYRGVIVPNVPCFRCDNCGNIEFAPETMEYIRKKVNELAPRVILKRKISTAAKKPIVYLPEELMNAARLEIGKDVALYVESSTEKKRRLVIEPLEE